jgi:DNA polymerase-3 subunit alpha
MGPFAEYAFNKSHTAGYGIVSYWTAYLKANYPAEYMAALLESVKGNKDKSGVYLGECRRMGVKILSPDINESNARFTPVADGVRFGLTAIRNVGQGVVEAIVKAREEQGKFTSFADFLAKVPAAVCNKRVVESLIKAGAFDSLGEARRALLEIHERAVDQVIDLKHNQAIGQDDLFGAGGGSDGEPVVHVDPVPDIPEWDKPVKLAFEREMLGLYVSDHPLNGVDHIIAAHRDVAIADLGQAAPGGNGNGNGYGGPDVAVAGMITEVTRRQTKKGEFWAQITLEDLDSSLQIMVFPKAYADCGPSLLPDTVVQVRGRARAKDEGVEFIASRVEPLDVTSRDDNSVTLTLPAGRVTKKLLGRLKRVLATYPGAGEVWCRLVEANSVKTFRFGDHIGPSGALMADLKAILGQSGVTLGKPR